MPVFLALLMALSMLLMDGVALAREPIVGGAPTAWQLNFQPPASPVAERI